MDKELLIQKLGFVLMKINSLIQSPTDKLLYKIKLMHHFFTIQYQVHVLILRTENFEVDEDILYLPAKAPGF